MLPWLLLGIRHLIAPLLPNRQQTPLTPPRLHQNCHPTAWLLRQRRLSSLLQKPRSNRIATSTDAPKPHRCSQTAPANGIATSAAASKPLSITRAAPNQRCGSSLLQKPRSNLIAASAAVPDPHLIAPLLTNLQQTSLPSRLLLPNHCPSPGLLQQPRQSSLLQKPPAILIATSAAAPDWPIGPPVFGTAERASSLCPFAFAENPDATPFELQHVSPFVLCCADESPADRGITQQVSFCLTKRASQCQ